MSHITDFFIKLMADYLVIPIVLIAAWTFFTLPAKVRYTRIAWAVVMGLTTLLVGKIASLLYQGQRPFEVLHQVPKAAYLANHGFPSDHVLFVFAITFTVWAATKNAKISGLLLALSGLVAVGRVIALVHTPLDVLGGIACALIAALVVYGASFFDRHLQD